MGQVVSSLITRLSRMTSETWGGMTNEGVGGMTNEQDIGG